jgi:hypothetical protein
MKIKITEKQVKLLAEQMELNEMGPKDWRFIATMEKYDHAVEIGDYKTMDYISDVVTTRKTASRERIFNCLLDMDYDDMSQVVDLLELD